MSQRTERIIAGWSRTRLRVRPGDLVLDVGCGSFPNARANIACDRSVSEDRHRTGRATVIDRPFVVADAANLPFRTGSVDFVIASHIGEHVEDPDAFCEELTRVAVRGYIETPSPLADVLLHEDYHRWRVGRSGHTVTFRRKGRRRRLQATVTDKFYAYFYAGRTTGEKPTRDLPKGLMGRMVGLLLYAIRGSLNRSGIMHTRARFSPEQPLRWRVTQRGNRSSHGTVGGRPRILFVDRDPPSGFMRSESKYLRQLGSVQTIVYPGRPTLRYLLDCVTTLPRVDVVWAFFASEHALLPTVVGRALRKRVIVVVGGYDTANVPELGYGLAAKNAGWLPKLIIRCADTLLPISSAAERELQNLVPSAASRSTVAHLAIDRDQWPVRHVERIAGTVITVAYVDAVSWRRKGIDRFVELALRDPDRSYILVGRVQPGLHLSRAALPNNLKVTGFLSQEELHYTLWSSDFYVQLSRHEGFGLSLAEAMACGCVPVVSDQAALREVIGPWGAVTSTSASDVLTCLSELTKSGTDRAAMRADVLERFSPERRARALSCAVKGDRNG